MSSSPRKGPPPFALYFVLVEQTALDNPVKRAVLVVLAKVLERLEK